MLDDVVKAVGNKLDKLDLYIDNVYLEKEDGINYLRVVLDASYVIDLDKVVMATRIINPCLDDLDIVDGAYTLDVYAKEKGEEVNG